MNKTSVFKYLCDLVAFGFLLQLFGSLHVVTALTLLSGRHRPIDFLSLCYSSNGVDHSENLSVHKPLCEIRC